MIPVRNAYDFRAGLPPAAREAIDAASRLQELARGAFILRKGEYPDHVHQILSGEAKSSSTSHDGRETVLALIGRHGWFALSEVFSGLPATSDVIALTRVQVRSLPRTALQTLMRAHPAIADQILRVMSLRLSLLYHFSVDRSVLSLKERVVKALYMRAHVQGDGDDANIPALALSQEELGKLLLAGRQALNRVLKALEREGLIQTGYAGVRRIDLPLLQQRYGHLVDISEPMPV